MKFRSTLAALVVALEAQAIAVPDTHVLHEKRDLEASSAWVKRDRVAPHAIVPVRVALTQTNLETAYDDLMAVSHPASKSFGKHLTADEVTALFAPPDATINKVKAWLTSAGLASSDFLEYETKGWLGFNAPAGFVEKLLHTELYEHEHRTMDRITIGSDSYHVPQDIQEHIDYITPGVKKSVPLKRKRTPLAKRWYRNPHSPWGWGPPHEKLPPFPQPWFPIPGSANIPPQLVNCSRIITPACLKALYHIPNATRSIPGQNLGLYESGDTYAQSSLDAFFQFSAPYVPNGTSPVPAFIDGASAPVAAGSTQETGESDIDLDIALSLIYPQNVTLYQTDDLSYTTAESNGDLEGYLNTFLDALDGSYCNYTAYGITGDSPGIDPTYPDPNPAGYKGQRQCGVYKPTNVISISYGEAEADLPYNYQKRQCNEFMKLALQGHSLFVASGDYGVSSFPGDGSPNGCLGPDDTIFSPGNPDNCPYITSVGATMLYPNQTIYTRESALHVNLTGDAQNFSSSGAFSNYFTRPSYQSRAVSTYFAFHDPGYPYYVYDSAINNIGQNGGLYNRAGRGTPDVSANGAHFGAFLGGRRVSFYGTSLAAPIWASVATLINQERAVRGKGPIGFINPTLYENPWALNDIVNGTNPGCGTNGFSAVEGWDPITGLGTPNFPRLLGLFLSLP